ncbi:MAG: adaptor protein MecA [Clostridia bacterium]|nr:adaptor protein MecA [Clostridia bacterium]
MERLENGCLKIILSEQELSERRLSFSLLDYRDAATRQALSQLLKEAQQRTGFHTTGTLLVEAVPLSDGCLLLITPEPTRSRLRIRRVTGPLVYTIADADSLLSLARGWRRDPQNARSLLSSSLYREAEGYRLVVYPAPAFSKRARRLLEVFSVECREGEAAAAFVAEHDTPLLIGNALPVISTSYPQE